MIYNPLLEAVNACLSGIGQQPVDSIDDPDLDAAMAMQVIHRVSRDTQARGWWFNKEKDWLLTVDPLTGFISPPINALSVIQNADLKYHQLTIRSDRIYDVDRHTYDLRPLADADGVISFDFVMYIDFNSLPPVAQYAITLISKRLFAQDLEVDATRAKLQARDEDRAISELYREDSRNTKTNYYNSSRTLAASGLFGSSDTFRGRRGYRDGTL